jgi:hypothetical protein
VAASGGKKKHGAGGDLVAAVAGGELAFASG